MRKKVILLFTAIMTTFMAQATTYMQVEQTDGTEVKYDVEKVSRVTYVEGEEEPVPSVVKTDGLLPGKFSISVNKQASFAQGNLQYCASSNTYRFAENQYDVIGEGNKNASSNYAGWIDLLEWTVFNTISNGGGWSTLSADEWNYILKEREGAESLRSQALVNGVKGYMLLPDGCILPRDLDFFGGAKDFKTNVYSGDEWTRMESLGALFLPYAGSRLGADIDEVEKTGNYWTSTSDGSVYAQYLYMRSGAGATMDSGDRIFGFCMRLVKVEMIVEKPNGRLPGRFSVSDSTQISFSMGNLQYQASTGIWRFAENQYDMIGEDNKNISATYDGWIDLFGWGTSGYHNSEDAYNKNYMPYSTSDATVNETYNTFGYGPSTNQASLDLTGTSANYDWGVYNAISNGGDKKGQWRVLSKGEWTYLYSGRMNCENLRTYATVKGVPGFLFFPDDWEEANCVLSVKLGSTDFDSNSFSALDWQVLEEQGAVFLPAAGIRDVTTVRYVGSFGLYCSSTYSRSRNAYGFDFGGSGVNPSSGGVNPSSDNGRCYGLSVRLVQE